MILSLWVLWRAIYTWLYLFIPRNHDFDERRNSHTRRKHSKLDLLITEKNKLKREPVMKTGRQFQFQSSDDTSLFDRWLFFLFIALKRKYSIAIEIEIRTVETVYYVSSPHSIISFRALCAHAQYTVRFATIKYVYSTLC